MKISDIVEKLNYQFFQSMYDKDDDEIENGYTSDLLSDVMGNCPDDAVFITIQGHKNAVAVAVLAGIKAIVLANGRIPSDDMLEAAADEEIAVIGTSDSQFTASWKVHNLLESE